MSPRAPFPSANGSRRCDRAGFTMVELIVATVVLSVGLLALTGAGAAIVRLERRADLLSQGAAAGETRLELLRAKRCFAISGSSDAGPIIEHWTVTPLSGGAREIVDSVGESGLATGGAGAARPAGAAAAARAFRSAVRC